MKINGKPDGGGGGDAIWGGITGTLSNQTDLMNKFSDYATESWVNNKGYVDSDDLSTALEGYVESSDSAVTPLYDRKEGYLRNHTYTPDVEQVFCSNGTQFFDQYGQCYVWNIGGKVYGINFLTPEVDEQNVQHIYIYQYDTTTNGFVHCVDANEQWIEINGDVTIPMISDVTTAHFLWEDSQGRVYYSNTHTVDLTTGTFTAKNMGGVVATYNGSKSNLIKFNGNIYLINATSATAGTSYLFDETTQTFSSAGALAGHGNKNFYRYGFYYGSTYYTMMVSGSTVQTRYLLLNGTTPRFQTTSAPFPTTITDDGTTYMIDGQHIRQVYDTEFQGVRLYCVFENKMWKLGGDMLDTWIKVDFYQDPGITYNANGAECNDYMVGFGYNADEPGVIPVWNFKTTTQRSTYGWDNSVETRLTAIETNLGTALDISNEILS